MTFDRKPENITGAVLRGLYFPPLKIR